MSELGRELYERLATMVDHFATLGKRLDGAVQAYNQTVGSLERRVLVSARKFPEHGIGTDRQIVELAPVDKSTQQPRRSSFLRAGRRRGLAHNYRISSLHPPSPHHSPLQPPPPP